MDKNNVICKIELLIGKFDPPPRTFRYNARSLERVSGLQMMGNKLGIKVVHHRNYVYIPNAYKNNLNDMLRVADALIAREYYAADVEVPMDCVSRLMEIV